MVNSNLNMIKFSFWFCIEKAENKQDGEKFENDVTD